MSLADTYARVRSSIVAFTLKYLNLPEGAPTPHYPPIVGTGFFVHEDGLVITNHHVVEACASLPKPDDARDDPFPFKVGLFLMRDQGMLEIFFEVLNVATVDSVEYSGVHYGPKKPDLAVVLIKAKGLPFLSLQTSPVPEGTEVAMAGFPMGLKALAAPGWLHQMTPTLQKGIVSAVLPYWTSAPHGYSINMMAQGGASGSPVFLPESGEVVGILHSAMVDIALTDDKSRGYAVPTNLSLAVPSHYAASMLKEVADPLRRSLPPDALRIDDMLRKAEYVNLYNEGRKWRVRGVKGPDGVRVTYPGDPEMSGRPPNDA